MVEKISIKILEYMKSKDPDINGDTEEIVLFGITRIVEEIPKLVLMIIVFSICGLLKEFSIVMLTQFVYKTYMGGVHARTNIACTFSTIFNLFCIVVLSKILILPSNVMYMIYFGMYLFGLYIINKYAPADTEEVPIINKELRKSLKIKAYISFNLIYIISIFIHLYMNVSIDITNTCIFTMFSVNLLATRFVYKMFKCKYGYEGSEKYEICN